jgi:hypothetical protein
MLGRDLRMPQRPGFVALELGVDARVRVVSVPDRGRIVLAAALTEGSDRGGARPWDLVSARATIR